MSNNNNYKYHDHLRDERSHMESILNQRFNYFLVIFGLIAASVPYVSTVNQLRFIFIIGFIIELVFTLLIGRAYRRLKINLDMLKKFNDPTKHIKEKADSGGRLNPFRYSAIGLMGYYMPIFITFVLFLSIFLSCYILSLFQSIN